MAVGRGLSLVGRLGGHSRGGRPLLFCPHRRWETWMPTRGPRIRSTGASDGCPFFAMGDGGDLLFVFFVFFSSSASHFSTRMFRLPFRQEHAHRGRVVTVLVVGRPPPVSRVAAGSSTPREHPIRRGRGRGRQGEQMRASMRERRSHRIRLLALLPRPIRQR